MKHLVLVLWLFTLLVDPALAVVPPAPPPAVATFDVGSIHVTQYGSGPQSLIFIPGLTCGPWEWFGQIAHFAPSYTIYALTLPGFDGRPPIAPPLFKTVSSDFWKLLAERHIDKPVVIGHSLGGTLGLMLATQHPELLRGVVALDGLPIFPGNNFLTPAQIKARANATASMIASETPAQFLASEQNAVLPSMITSRADVAAVAPLVARSNVRATAQWLREDLELDLRPQLPKATVPILEIAPYDAAVDSRYLPSLAAKRTYYEHLLAGAPHATVLMIANSRHFAMYDQPQAVTDAIAGFLAPPRPPAARV